MTEPERENDTEFYVLLANQVVPARLIARRNSHSIVSIMGGPASGVPVSIPNAHLYRSTEDAEMALRAPTRPPETRTPPTAPPTHP